MPTPPVSIPVNAPIQPISTPEISLPCGRKVPSIPLVPDLSFTLTIPPINLFPTKKPKKGARKTRKKSKNGGTGETIAQKIARYQAKLCSPFAPKRATITEAPPVVV